MCECCGPGIRRPASPFSALTPLTSRGLEAQQPGRTGVDTRWPRVRLSDPLAAMYLRRILDDAAMLVDDRECQLLLTDFNDGEGQPLTGRLSTLGTSLKDYLNLLYFTEGSSRDCADGAFAVTMPGSRVVWICATSVKKNWSGSPRHATADVIHEALHSLGLKENPPSSAEITAQVLKRCGRD